jgi:hypothetical protein
LYFSAEKQIKAFKVRNSKFGFLGKMGNYGVPYHGIKYGILAEKRFRIYP